MMESPGVRGTRSLLLVEDNPADANLVRMYLSEPDGDFDVVHVSNVSDAVAALQAKPIDLILLDLRLPDSQGVETVETIRAAARSIPIIALSGLEDERLGESCVSNGAEDFLAKADLRRGPLRRVVGYAIRRHDGSEHREAEEVRDRLRSLSSEAPHPSLSAAIASSESVRERVPEVFGALVDAYADLLVRFLERGPADEGKPKTEMQVLVKLLGDRGAGPRDLVDVHLAALERAVAEGNRRR